jgi:hypothetical protein
MMQHNGQGPHHVHLHTHGCVHDTQKPLIAYQDRICLALLAPNVDTRLFLTQGFWPQSLVKIVEFDAIFFNNGDIYKNLRWMNIMFGHACNCPTPSFHVVVDCYECYMNLGCARDIKHLKPIWLIKTLSPSNFVPASPNFCQIKMEYYDQSRKTHYAQKVSSGLWTQLTNQFG